MDTPSTGAAPHLKRHECPRSIDVEHRLYFEAAYRDGKIEDLLRNLRQRPEANKPISQLFLTIIWDYCCLQDAGEVKRANTNPDVAGGLSFSLCFGADVYSDTVMRGSGQKYP